MVQRLQLKTPQVPVNTATAASGFSLFAAAEDHDHGLSGSDFDHGELLGLTGDDHVGYALLAGRSGGQTLIGGTGTTDDLILRATTGVGASGSDIIFQVGNNGATEAIRILDTGFVGFNSSAPDSRHVINDNAIGSVAVSIPTNPKILLHIQGADSATNPSILVDSFGTTGPGIVMRRSRGTILAPSAMLNGNNIFQLFSSAYGATAYSTPQTVFSCLSAQNWTDANQGTEWRFFSTVNGTTTSVQRLTLTNNGNLVLGILSANSNGSAALLFTGGTAPTSMVTNTAGMYADDISGNVSMHVMNENGNIIKLIKTGTYTPTNVTVDRSYDANSTSIDELADVLGTLIADLQLTGLIG